MTFNDKDWKAKFGSIEWTKSEVGAVYSFQGLSADADKLDLIKAEVVLGGGSSCLMLDTAEVYMYHQQSKQWYAL